MSVIEKTGRRRKRDGCRGGIEWGGWAAGQDGWNGKYKSEKREKREVKRRERVEWEREVKEIFFVSVCMCARDGVHVVSVLLSP